MSPRAPPWSPAPHRGPRALALCPLRMLALRRRMDKSQAPRSSPNTTASENNPVAIVVYADQATTDEFTENRKEITNFVATQLRSHPPPHTRAPTPRKSSTGRMTPSTGLPCPKKTSPNTSPSAAASSTSRLPRLHPPAWAAATATSSGHIRAQLQKSSKSKPPATPPPGPPPSIPRWPKRRPGRSHRLRRARAVRARVLQTFAEDLVNHLYDHKEYDKLLRTDHQRRPRAGNVAVTPTHPKVQA